MCGGGGPSGSNKPIQFANSNANAAVSEAVERDRRRRANSGIVNQTLFTSGLGAAQSSANVKKPRLFGAVGG